MVTSSQWLLAELARHLVSTAIQKFVTSFEAGRRAGKEHLRRNSSAISSRCDTASAADRPKMVTNFWGAVLSMSIALLCQRAPIRQTISKAKVVRVVQTSGSVGQTHRQAKGYKG